LRRALSDLARRERQCGAALVLALLVMTLGVLLVSGAFLRQSVMVRQVENDAAGAQARWLLTGAIDWVRVVLREDGRSTMVDHVGEPWAAPLELTRIDGIRGETAWVSGRVEDAQSRFNLRNLAGPAGPVAAEVAVLARLLDLVGLDGAGAGAFALRLQTALLAQRDRGVAMQPATIDALALVEPADRVALERLAPFVTLLPVPTSVNLNTAPAEVIAARFANLPLADARQIVTDRARGWFRDPEEIQRRRPGLRVLGDAGRLAVNSRFFLLRGSVEVGRARVAGRALLQRDGDRVEVLWLHDEPNLVEART
jgi:general secretion pathway protein K